jgi:hypothetical protein
MDLWKKLWSISKSSLKINIIIWVTIIAELAMIAITFLLIGNGLGTTEAWVLIVFMVLIVLITIFIYFKLLAKYTWIIYENGIEVTDTKSKLKESIYYTEIEEFYAIYDTLLAIVAIWIKKKDWNWIIFSKRNGWTWDWDEKLVNAFSDAIYSSYNDKFISGEKIPFSYYDKKVFYKSGPSWTKFFETTKPNTLYLSKNWIEVNGNVFSKKYVDGLFSKDIYLLSKSAIFFELVEELE